MNVEEVMARAKVECKDALEKLPNIRRLELLMGFEELFPTTIGMTVDGPDLDAPALTDWFFKNGDPVADLMDFLLEEGLILDHSND